MNFLKKHWGNIAIFAFIILLVIPQTRMPIQVFVQRVISFSPSEKSQTEIEKLENYNWPLRKLNEEEINFSQSKNRVAIVNFWATWCPPCVAEMPSFQKLFNTYGDKVDFYFVTSEKPEKVENFMAKNGYNFPVYLQSKKAPDVMQSAVLPTTFVISKTGRIVIEEEGAADWNSKRVKELLAKLILE